MSTRCPCHSHQLYAECCEPYLTGKHTAPTAEALMRSRYTAFAKRKFAYLVKTMKGAAAKAFNIAAAKKDAPFIHWLKLEVIHAQEQNDAGVVEFKAHFQYQNTTSVLHEESQFLKINGEWFYVSGHSKML